MSQPWEDAPVVEDKAPWEAAPVVDSKKSKRTGAAAVPTADEAAGRGYTPPKNDQPAQAEPGFLDKLRGAAEAGVNATTGLVGSVAGGLAAIPVSALSAASELQRGGISGFRRENTLNPVEAMDKVSQGVGGTLKRVVSGPMDLRQEQTSDTALGQQYTEQYVQPVMESLPAVAALHGTMGPAGGLKAGASAVRGTLAEAKPAIRAAASDIVNRNGTPVERLAGLAAAERPSVAQSAASTQDASLALPRKQGIVDALDNGFKLSPKAAESGGLVERVAPGAGDAKLAKELSSHNVENGARLIREDVGLAPDQPLTHEALTAIREEEGTKYQVLKDAGTLTHDAKFGRDLDGIVGEIKSAAEDYPDLLNNSIIKRVDGLRNPEVKFSSAVEVVRDLRNEADKAYRSGDKKLGRAYRDSAMAVDNSMDRALTAKAAEPGAPPGLANAVSDYQAARTRIAKTYTADAALSGNKPGEPNLLVYGRVYAKNPNLLSGPGKAVGQFASQFGKEGLAQSLSKSERGAHFGFGDLLLAALHPGMALSKMAIVGARPGTRAFLASERGQQAIGKNARQAVADAEARNAPAAPPADPTLTQGFEPPTPPTTPSSPLGDLTPEWGTTPGVNSGRGMPVEEPGFVPVLHDPEMRPAAGGYDPRRGSPVSDIGPVVPGISAEPPRVTRGAGSDIPAVEGRPDLPDSLVTGAPSESAATDRANAAMMDPGAIEARRQQQQVQVDTAANAERAQTVPVGQASEISPQVVEPAQAPQIDPRLAEVDYMRQGQTSPTVLKALDAHEAKIKKTIKLEQLTAQRRADAVDLRRVAKASADPALAQTLMDQADKLDRPAIQTFKDLADKHNIPKEAAAAAMATARGMEPDAVGPYLTRVIEALQKRELIEKPIDKGALKALTAEPEIPVGEATHITDSGVTRAEPKIPTGEAKELYVPPEKIKPTDLQTADGQPYGTKAAAQARATREGGHLDVVEVPGGWVVREAEKGTRESPQPDVQRTAGKPAGGDAGGSAEPPRGSGIVGRVAADAGEQHKDAPHASVASSGKAGSVRAADSSKDAVTENPTKAEYEALPTGAAYTRGTKTYRKK